MFSKLKALLRKAAARTRNALWDTIGRLLQGGPLWRRFICGKSAKATEGCPVVQSLGQLYVGQVIPDR